MHRTTSQLLTRMRLVDPASPRLVWHGAEGRIELSGRVFDNWVAKTSNLLVDELDATPSTSVELDLPPHWKSLAIAFACWQAGCVLVLPDEDGPSSAPVATDILMTARTVPAIAPPRLLVCVALGSLAFRWDADLPGGAVDFAAEVRSHGDVFFDTADEDDARVLVHAGGSSFTAAELQTLVRMSSGQDRGEEAPVTALFEPGASLLHTLSAAITTWNQDGTLVLVEQGVEVTQSMLAGERVTSRLESA